MSASVKVLIYKIKRELRVKVSSIFDMLIFKLSKGSGKPRANTILFVGEQLPARIPRLAKWLNKKSDYKLILLCHQHGFVSQFVDDCFDEIYLFRNKFHLRRLLEKIGKPTLMHAFAPKSEMPYYAMKFFPDVPYVHDMQDVYGIYYGLSPTDKWLVKELPFEKACLEQADGIVAHSLEPREGIKAYKIKSQSKKLFFPLYCDSDYFAPIDFNKSLEKIEIVYVGGVTGKHRNPKRYGHTQFHDLIDIFSKQKIHFHIYPSPSTLKADYEEYQKIGLENEYFHFHKPIKQAVLSEELSKYTMGILPFFFSQTEQSITKTKYSTTLKMFNYLEAGLPVLYAEDLMYQGWLLKRYNMGMGINQENLNHLDVNYIRREYPNLQKAVESNREKLTIENNIDRLIKFYRILTQDKD